MTPKPVHRAFFGLSAILVLSPRGSWITRGIESLFFWVGVGADPLQPRSKILQVPPGLLEETLRVSDWKLQQYHNLGEGRKVLREGAESQWSPILYTEALLCLWGL